MQTSEAEGTLSWHGELGGDAMHGVASWRKSDGVVVNYNFAGRKVVEPAAPKPKTPEPKPKAPTRSP